MIVCFKCSVQNEWKKSVFVVVLIDNSVDLTFSVIILCFGNPKSESLSTYT